MSRLNHRPQLDTSLLQLRAAAPFLGIVLATTLAACLAKPSQAFANLHNSVDSQNLSSNSDKDSVHSSTSDSSRIWVQILALVDKGRWSEACRSAEKNLQNLSPSQKSQFIGLAISAPKACGAREPHEWAELHLDLQTLPPGALWKSLESAFECKAWNLGLKLADALQRNPHSSSTQRDLAAYHRAWILWNQNHQDQALKELFDLQTQTSDALLRTQALKDYAVLSYRSQKVSNLSFLSSAELEVWKSVAQEHKALFERPAEKARLAAVPPSARSSIARALWSLPSAGAIEACHLLQTTEHLNKEDLMAIRESFESKARNCWSESRTAYTPANRVKKGVPLNFVSVMKIYNRLNSLQLQGWERSFVLEQAEAEKSSLSGKSGSALAGIDRVICAESLHLLQHELEHKKKREAWPYLWNNLRACQPELQTLAKALPSLKTLGSLVDSWLAQTQSGAVLMDLFSDLKFENFPQSQKRIFQDLFDQKFKVSPELEQNFLQTADQLPELNSQLGLFHFSRGNFAALSGAVAESLRQSFERNPALWKSQWMVLWPHRKNLNWPELNQLTAQLESGKMPEAYWLTKFGLERLVVWQKLLELQAQQLAKPMNLARIEEAVNRLHRAMNLQGRLFNGLPQEWVTLSQQNLTRLRSELAAALERSPAGKVGLSAKEMQVLVGQLKQGRGS